MKKLLKNRQLLYGAGILAAIIAGGWAIDHYWFWPARQKRTRQIEFKRQTFS